MTIIRLSLAVTLIVTATITFEIASTTSTTAAISIGVVIADTSTIANGMTAANTDSCRNRIAVLTPAVVTTATASTTLPVLLFGGSNLV